MAWWNRLSNGGKAAVLSASIVVGYLGYRWYRNYQAAKAAAANSTTSATAASPVPAGTTAASGIGGGQLQPPTVGGMPFQGNTWTDPNTGDTWYEISGAVAGGGTPGSLVGVWVDGTTGAIQYGSPPFTQTPAPPTPAPAPAPAAPPSTTPPAQAPVTPVNAQDFPIIVPFGDYKPGDFTQIGTVQNGVYQGTNVRGGAPVYANVYGGFAQDFDMATLPNGTGIYIPTIFTSYEAA